MKRFVLVLFASLVLPSVASADSFSATFAGTGRGAGVSGMVNGSAFSVWAGEIKWTSDSFLDDFTSFCVQLDSHLNSTQVFEAPADLGHISAYKEGQIAFLVGNAVSSNWMAAGLQLAIWNVIYDDDFTVSAGLFTSSTAGAADSANTFLGVLADEKLPFGNAIFLDSIRQGDRNGQDQVTSVPEPATLVLLGTGIVAMAGRRRMRRAR